MLFAAAKSVAAQRRTTLKAMFEHALRREIVYEEQPSINALFETNGYGFPVLKKRDALVVTNEQVYQMLDEETL